MSRPVAAHEDRQTGLFGIVKVNQSQRDCPSIVPGGGGGESPTFELELPQAKKMPERAVQNQLGGAMSGDLPILASDDFRSSEKPPNRTVKPLEILIISRVDRSKNGPRGRPYCLTGTQISIGPKRPRQSVRPTSMPWPAPGPAPTRSGQTPGSPGCHYRARLS